MSEQNIEKTVYELNVEINKNKKAIRIIRKNIAELLEAFSNSSDSDKATFGTQIAKSLLQISELRTQVKELKKTLNKILSS